MQEYVECCRVFKIVCLLCALDKVVKLVECALDDALALTLVHRCQRQCKVSEILGRQITITCRIINLVL